jgi:hypothetical protein
MGSKINNPYICFEHPNGTHSFGSMSNTNRQTKVNELIKERASLMKYKHFQFTEYLKLTSEQRKFKGNDGINEILSKTDDNISSIEKQITALAKCNVTFNPDSLAVSFNYQPANQHGSESFKNYKITRVHMIDKIERMLKKSRKSEIKKILNLIK